MIGSKRYSSLLLLGLALAKCSAFKSDPLHHFEASNGNYFPPYIQKFFEAANKFELEFGSLSEAQSRIRVIQVKALTKNSNNENEANLSWSEDGAFLSYEIIADDKRTILVKDLTQGFSRTLAVVPNKKHDFLAGFIDKNLVSYNANLSWSKDSNRFAFMSNGGIGEYNIYVGGVGTPEQPVAKSPTKDGFANWSPTSDEIAFVSARSGNGDIYLLDLGDDSLVNLTKTDNIDIFPTWTKDGHAVVFSSGGASAHRIMLVQKKDSRWGEPETVTQWDHDSLRPVLSPDGKYIAFYASTQGGLGDKVWNIHVIPYSSRGLTETQLNNTIVAKDVIVDLNTGPAWTPDSRKIFFVKRDSKNYNPIQGYDLFSGKPYVLRTNTKMNRDLIISKLGVLSFRAQVGVWDRVFLALTNQGVQLQTKKHVGKIQYLVN
ncbi:MAG: TolB family protein [Oligoflexales bacterium]